MGGDLTIEERDFLETLVEDGWPLAIQAARLDDEKFQVVQSLALQLVRKGVAGIYSQPADSSDLQISEAERVVNDPQSWRQGSATIWMIAATAAGNALLEASES
jgi:hypothetical protein